MINIDNQYSESIVKLKQNETISFSLKKEDLNYLSTEFIAYLDKKNWEQLKKIIFIFQFSTKKYFSLNGILNQACKSDLPDEITIYLLGLYPKHIFTPVELDGLRLPKETIDALKMLGERLDNDPFEWFLRTIENLTRNDLVHFTKIIQKKHGGFFQNIRKKNRIKNELIELILEKTGDYEQNK